MSQFCSHSIGAILLCHRCWSNVPRSMVQCMWFIGMSGNNMTLLFEEISGLRSLSVSLVLQSSCLRLLCDPHLTWPDFSCRLQVWHALWKQIYIKFHLRIKLSGYHGQTTCLDYKLVKVFSILRLKFHLQIKVWCFVGKISASDDIHKTLCIGLVC